MNPVIHPVAQEQENYLLSGLFFTDPSNINRKNLKNGLIEYRFFLTTVLETHEILKNRDLQKFDGHVGDTACQIRAVKVAMSILKNSVNFDQIKDRAQQIKGSINHLLLSSEMADWIRSGKSLQDILDKNQWQLPLTSEQQFFLQSYVLSEIKEPESDEKFISSLCKTVRFDRKNLRKLQRLEPQITVSFANNLVYKFKKLLSESSVDFVRKTAMDLQDRSLQHMVSEEYTYRHDNWLLCTPTFWASKILLKTTRVAGIALVIYAKFFKKERDGFRLQGEEHFLYKPSKDSQDAPYVAAVSTREDLEEPACVIQGIVCSENDWLVPSKEQWKLAMATKSIVDVVLSGTAAHSQYPDQTKDIAVKDLEYEKYKAYAKDQGCTVENPTLFFTQHIYAAQVGKIFDVMNRADVPLRSLPLPSLPTNPF